MKLFLPSLAVAAALLAGWWVQFSAATRLNAQLEAARFDDRQLRALQSEHDRLSRLLPTADQLASLAQANAERDRLLRDIPVSKPSSTPLPLGEWRPASAWENRGRSTARATIETALWAAAGGDISALESLLEIGDATRAKATELLAKLPPDARKAWATPEALIASATTKNIPLSDAQIVWFHEHDADHAGIGLLLNIPDHPAAGASSVPPASGGKLPPTLGDTRDSKLAFISLHRSENGWSLVVPSQAIDRIARELATPSK